MEEMTEVINPTSLKREVSARVVASNCNVDDINKALALVSHSHFNKIKTQWEVREGKPSLMTYTSVTGLQSENLKAASIYGSGCVLKFSEEDSVLRFMANEEKMLLKGEGPIQYFMNNQDVVCNKVADYYTVPATAVKNLFFSMLTGASYRLPKKHSKN